YFQRAIVLESVSLANPSVPRERPTILDLEGVFRPLNASDSDSPNPAVREVAQIYGSKSDAVAAMNAVIEPALIADSGPRLATETRRLADELTNIESTDAHIQTTVAGSDSYQLVASPVAGACKGQTHLSFGLKLAWQSLQPALAASFEVDADLDCIGCLD